MNVLYDFPVLQMHIDGGICNEPERCALALAGQDYLGCKVEVEATWMRVDESIYKIKRYLYEWVRDFDDGKEYVDPIRVILYEENNILMADVAEGYDENE